MPTHNQIISAAIEKAAKDLDHAEKLILHDVTRKLQKKYKGKKVKCVCFDVWRDGDDYYFEDELLDIIVYKMYNADTFFIDVTFMYRSTFAKEGESARRCTFHLDLSHPIKIIH